MATLNKKLHGRDLETGDSPYKVPCGTYWLSIAPADKESEYAIRYPGGRTSTEIKITFCYNGPFPLESSTADPMTIECTKGRIHINHLA